MDMNVSDPLYERDTALQREIYREKVERARSLSRGERMLLGPQLFDMAVGTMRAGIRHRHPEYSDEQVESEVVRRLELGRRLHSRRRGV